MTSPRRAALVLTLSAACATPRPVPEPLKLPAAYPGSSATATTTPPPAPLAPSETPTAAAASVPDAAVPTVAQLDWRALFADPRLVDLIAQALRNNPDRAITLERIAIARAGVRRGTGALLPELSATSAVGLRRFGLYTMDGAGNASTDILPGEPVPLDLPDFLVGFQTSWELDLWGRLWNLRQSARANALAHEEAAHLVESSLVANVASTWFELVAVDRDRAVLESILERQTTALELMRAQKEAGRANELAVQQFEAELNDTRADARVAAQRAAILERALNLLVGRVPTPIERDNAQPLPAVWVAPGLPAELLRYRPDVRAAELGLQAAAFDVRAAQAAFFPSLDIGGGLFLQAFNPLYLVNPDSIAYSIAGGLVGPLINRNAIQADFDVADAMQIEAAYTYQKVVLEAFIEASNALDAVRLTEDLMRLRDQQRALRQQSADTADALFRAGKAGWFEVLLAQAAAANADRAAIDAWRDHQLAVVALYRALGGGWTTAAPTPPQADQGLVDALLQDAL